VSISVSLDRYWLQQIRFSFRESAVVYDAVFTNHEYHDDVGHTGSRAGLLQRHDHYDVSQLIRIIQKYRKTRGLQLPLRQLQQHAKRHSSIMCGGIIVICRMGIRRTTPLAPPACCHFWRLVFILLVVLAVRMSDRNIHRSRNVNSKPLLLHRHCRLLSLFKPLTFLVVTTHCLTSGTSSGNRR